MKTRETFSTARAAALIRKETRQMMRDKSTLTLGIILPMVLLLLFGFGLSLDVTLVPVTVVRDTMSPATRDIYTALKLSPYFEPVMAGSMHEAEARLRSGKTDAIVRRAKDESDGAERIQIVTNARDSNKARIMQRYLEGAVARWGAAAPPPPQGQAAVEARVWFNDAMESRHFLIPGVSVLIMTLIGSLLTALVIAREWERGTYESLIATAATPAEIMVSKTVPYFALGMVGLFLCLAAAAWVFQVPMRGSLALIVMGSSIYLFVALGIGLFISSTLKSQFLASQVVLIFSFLPTLMLSGFVFDLQSAPRVIYYIGHIVPATWYVELMQTLFLAGDVPFIVLRDFLMLTGYAVFTLALATRTIKKTLE